MAYESTDTVIYRPDGLDAVTLCQVGDIMVVPVDPTASVQVQRDGVLGSAWMLQRSRGNALMQLSFTVAHPFPTAAAARAWGLDVQEMFTLHPLGRITWLTCYFQGRPQRVREYTATVDPPHPFPLTSDHWYGFDEARGAAWQAVEFKFALTGDID